MPETFFQWLGIESKPRKKPRRDKLEIAREKWEKLRAEFLTHATAYRQADIDLAVKHGPGHHSWMSRGERAKLDKLAARRDRVQSRMFEMTKEFSPRNWSHGVPAWWIAEKLTFADMIRPISEPLSVTPPLAYGASEPMR
jgi:hypothetical protein